MQPLSTTQTVIDWFENIIHKNRWDGSATEEMQARIQELIDSEYLNEECFNQIGETAWDDWTEYLSRRYPHIEVDRESVDWGAVGKFLVERLKLKLWVDQELWM
jgi:hypothetical protein